MLTPRIPSPSPLRGTSLPCASPGQFLSLLPENLLQRAHLDFYEYPYFLQVEDPPFKHSEPPGLGGWDTGSPAVCIHGPMPPLPHSQYNQDNPSQPYLQVWYVAELLYCLQPLAYRQGLTCRCSGVMEEGPSLDTHGQAAPDAHF